MVSLVNNSLGELSNSFNSLQQSNEWKLFSSLTGSKTLTLPNNFNELFITVSAQANSSNYLYSFSIPRIALSEGIKTFMNTNSTDNNGSCSVGVSLSKIYLSNSYYGTTSIKSSSKLTVYYK